MRTRWSGRLVPLAGAAAALAWGLPATAQLAPGGQARGGLNQRRQARQGYTAQLAQIADQLGRHFQAKVVIDPAIEPRTAPQAPAEAANLEAALDTLTSTLGSSAWRRVYLRASEATSPGAPARLAAAVRALDQLEQGGLVIENAATRRATTYYKGFQVPENFAEMLTAQQFSPTPVYVVYSTVAPTADVLAGGNTPTGRFLNLQRQQMDLMMQMSPEEMQNAMAQSMQMYMSMDPQVRQQFMGNMMRSGMQMFMNMPPEQRNQMMQEMMQNVQGVFGNMAGPPPPPGGPAGPPHP